MQPYILYGVNSTDERGTVGYLNQFDLSRVKRFYTIEHPNTDVVRGWRGHRIDQRWFHVSRGSFLVTLVQIDDWASPNPNGAQLIYTLLELDFPILYMPAGYASKIQALEKDSKMIVFADSTAEEGMEDNYLYPVDYFIA